MTLNFVKRMAEKFISTKVEAGEQVAASQLHEFISYLDIKNERTYESKKAQTKAARS